jgi:hypothetical protein
MREFLPQVVLPYEEGYVRLFAPTMAAPSSRSILPDADWPITC